MLTIRPSLLLWVMPSVTLNSPWNSRHLICITLKFIIKWQSSFCRSLYLLLAIYSELCNRKRLPGWHREMWKDAPKAALKMFNISHFPLGIPGPWMKVEKEHSGWYWESQICAPVKSREEIREFAVIFFDTDFTLEHILVFLSIFNWLQISFFVQSFFSIILLAVKECSFGKCQSR